MCKQTELEIATNKFEQSKKFEVDLNVDIQHFVTMCYNRLKPCSYGNWIQRKIAYDIGAYNIQPSKNKGDILLKKTFYEVKSSFLGKTNGYRITHLRLWQDVKFYMICFVDCENSFQPEFYVVDKLVFHKMNLCAMNGTTDANSKNLNVELSVTIKKNDTNHNLLKKYNLMKGNTYNDLILFSENTKLY
jgi:hypothetical protein